MNHRTIAKWLGAGCLALGLLGVFAWTNAGGALGSDSGEVPVKILSLTKSSGYEHSVIHREGGELGHAEKILMELADANNMVIVITKDGGLINEEQLKDFDVVHFYTTGELCERGNDNNPPMSEEGRRALLNFVKNGGGFVGTHTTTDTFHNWEVDGEYPYLKMVGGEFAWHGKQQTAEMWVKEHSITSHLGKSWTLLDEYYVHKRVTNTFDPLLIVNTASMEEERYKELEPYPITWCEQYGEGRVFNTSLGHREDVWTNPSYQQLVVNGILWAAGRL